MLADLVEQQTTTTGNVAPYTVSGTVTGRRTFADALANLDVVPYVCTDDAGEFECGIGTWNEGAGTLSRATITASSNAGAAVNWAAGTRRLYVSLHAATAPFFTGVKHNVRYSGSAPTVNDDSADGYLSGSMWGVESTPSWYICVDPGAGAARWSRMPIKANTAAFRSYRFDGGTLDTAAWAHYCNTGHSFSGGQLTDGSTFWQFADGAVFSLMAKTTTATERTMAYADDYTTYDSIYCEGSSVATLTGTVQAIDTATGDSKAWKVEAVAKTNGSFVTSIVAGGTPAELYEDAGATAWALAIEASGQEILVNVTGEAAKTIIWGASLQFGIAAHNV